MDTDLKREFSLEESELVGKHSVECSTYSAGKCKSKLHGYLILHKSEWLRVIKQVTIHADKDVEFRKEPPISGKNAT